MARELKKKERRRKNEQAPTCIAGACFPNLPTFDHPCPPLLLPPPPSSSLATKQKPTLGLLLELLDLGLGVDALFAHIADVELLARVATGQIAAHVDVIVADDARDEVAGGHALGALRLDKLAGLFQPPVAVAVYQTRRRGRRRRRRRKRKIN